MTLALRRHPALHEAALGSAEGSRHDFARPSGAGRLLFNRMGKQEPNDSSAGSLLRNDLGRLARSWPEYRAVIDAGVWLDHRRHLVFAERRGRTQVSVGFSMHR